MSTFIYNLLSVYLDAVFCCCLVFWGFFWCLLSLFFEIVWKGRSKNCVFHPHLFKKSTLSLGKRSQINKWGNFDILIAMFSLHDIQSKASICLLTFKERKCISCLSIWYFFNVNLLFRLWLTFKILSQLMDYSVCRCFN